MDGYIKVWLQLLFPVYIITLVTIVLIISEHSSGRFARLVSYSNSVAALATLILLSYTKLLRTIIAALSFTTLEYPDGSHETVWLYDANISYLEGKHIPLFIAALLILLVGLLYTLLLFFWQWLLKLENILRTRWKINILKWCNNSRLQSFLRAYHGPYSDRCRYWTGLLLMARILLFLISSLDHIIGDPSVNLLTVVCVVGSILVLKTVGRPGFTIYKKWPLDILETSFLFNLLVFSAATLYTREIKGNQTALAYTSTSITFITFLSIIIYHMIQFRIKKMMPRENHRSEIVNTYRNRHHNRNANSTLNATSPTQSASVKQNDYTEIDSDEYGKCTFATIDGLPDPHGGDENLGHDQEASTNTALHVELQHLVSVDSGYTVTDSTGEELYTGEKEDGDDVGSQSEDGDETVPLL